MQKPLKISLVHDRYGDLREVIQQIRELTGTVTAAQITADALRDRLARLQQQKKRDERRDHAA